VDTRLSGGAAVCSCVRVFVCSCVRVVHVMDVADVVVWVCERLYEREVLCTCVCVWNTAG
jgi:hypothetical protein